MKTYKYKIIGLLIMLSFGIKAQTFDKKYHETFKVNSDVTIEVNTSHTDVDIETWNRNEVEVEAVIEVEGVDKKEAEKIVKNWKFEALGNKSKVKITSPSRFIHFNFKGDYDFNYDFEFPEIAVEISQFEMPEIPELPELPEMPEMPEVPAFPEFPAIELPEMDIEVFEFDYQKYKNDSSYLENYKKKISKEMEKYEKSDWKKKLDSVRNTKEYKEKMEAYKKASAEMAKKLKESEWYIKLEDLRNSEEFKKNIEESKKAAQKVREEMLKNKEKLKAQAELAKKESEKIRFQIKEMKEKGELDSVYNYSFSYSSGKDSKIKIKKYLKIKVPKKATFKLNVRHGKLNVPKSYNKMSATISYGNFVGGVIEGDKNNLTISNSPVLIKTVNSGNITLKNVPNATFGTFSNANLFANSSDVLIDEIGTDVALSQKFGNLKVVKIVPDFGKFNVILDYAKGTINLTNAAFVFDINGKKSTLNLNNALNKTTTNKKDGVDYVKGYFKNNTTSNKVNITGVYSTIHLK